MSGQTPRVWGTYVEDPQQVEEPIRLDTVAWQAWLEAPTTRRFRYPVFDAAAGYIVGFMTVRKEERERGGTYWVAYRRCNGRLRKAYLGRSSGLSRDRLEQHAQRFLAASRAADGEETGDGGFQ